MRYSDTDSRTTRSELPKNGLASTREVRNVFSSRAKSTESGQVAVTLGDAAIGPNGSRKLKALAEVGARSNQFFLAELMNLNDPRVQGPQFERVIRWFSRLSIINPNQELPPALVRDLAENEDFSRFAGAFLREIGTGISGVVVTTEEGEGPAITDDRQRIMSLLFFGHIDSDKLRQVGAARRPRFACGSFDKGKGAISDAYGGSRFGAGSRGPAAVWPRIRRFSATPASVTDSISA